MFSVRARALPGLETYAVGEKEAQILDQLSSSLPGMKGWKYNRAHFRAACSSWKMTAWESVDGLEGPR